MSQNPIHHFHDSEVRALLQRLEQTSSPHEYMRTIADYHNRMIQEGVKTATPSTISDLVLFEAFWGLDMDPDALRARYEAFFPGESLEDPATQGMSHSTALATSAFAKRIGQMWNKLTPHSFIKQLKEYHWHLWREGMEDLSKAGLLGIIAFEREIGLPLRHEDIVDSYKVAQFGFVKKKIECDARLNTEFADELSFAMPGKGKPSGRGAMTIEPNWENYWGSLPGYSFDELKEKRLLPLFWYLHSAEEEFGAAYKGVALMERGRVLYYDRYPMGGGPYEIEDLRGDFKNRSKIVAANIERAVAEVDRDLARQGMRLLDHV